VEPARILFGSSAFRINLLKIFQVGICGRKSQETLFHGFCLALDESPACGGPVRYPFPLRSGSLHRAKLRAACYLSLGPIKIDDREKQIKKERLFSIHN
jgi:hypothetical protein